jgi:uncharacterized protein (DUF2147 family)
MMERDMNKLWIGAAVALMTTSAYAGETFHVGIKGGTARIEVPRNCHQLSCLNLSYRDRDGKAYSGTDLKGLIDKHGKTDTADDDKVTDAPVSSPFTTHAATVTPTTTAKLNPARVADTVASDPPPKVDQTSDRAPVDTVRDTPAVAEETVADTAPPKTDVVKAPRTGPIGEWLVEDGSGQVRIEPCGANLCGYVSHGKDETMVDSKNPNPALRHRSIIGMPVLIDMRPDKNRWNGKIYNAKDGRTYMSHIEMRNPNTLRVEGCAFGGMFCGGQTWKRVS